MSSLPLSVFVVSNTAIDVTCNVSTDAAAIADKDATVAADYAVAAGFAGDAPMELICHVVATGLYLS